MKLYGIKTIEGANQYLEDKFLDKINERFTQKPDEPINSHRDASSYGNLDEILCWHYKRQLRNDWSIQFNREYFQIKKMEDPKLQPGEFITLRKYLDGSMCFWYEDQKIAFYRLQRKPEPPSKTKKSYIPKEIDTQKISNNSRKNKHKTPWGQFNPHWLSGK